MTENAYHHSILSSLIELSIKSETFEIGSEDRAMTIGSSFALKLGPLLQASSLQYLITEPGIAFANGVLNRTSGYGVFTARYGKVASPRQLRQLFERAYGSCSPQEDLWEGRKGMFDPFRPKFCIDPLHPIGYVQPSSRSELLLDRASHYEAVRTAFETAGVLLIDLEVTGNWTAPDGAVVPFHPSDIDEMMITTTYAYQEPTDEDLLNDLHSFLSSLQTVNGSCKVIFCISPLSKDAPAWLIPSHVSDKLRTALRTTIEKFDNSYYFPLFELFCQEGEILLSSDRGASLLSWQKGFNAFFEAFFSRQAPNVLDIAPGYWRYAKMDEMEKRMRRHDAEIAKLPFSTGKCLNNDLNQLCPEVKKSS